MKTYGIDQKGFIITDVHKKYINKIYKKMINEVKKNLIAKLDKKILSIYIYGSIARGTAIIKKSDLDIEIVFKRKPGIKSKKIIKEIEKSLSIKYLNLVRGIGISMTSLKEINENYYGRGACIKHGFVLLFGQDLGKNYPKFKPTKKVAKGFNGDVKEVLNELENKLKLANTNTEIKTICSSIMRKILRTGFCLIANKEKSRTTDLKKSFEIFCKYYPLKSNEIKAIYKLALKPTANKDLIYNILNNMGKWMINEAYRVFKSNKN